MFFGSFAAKLTDVQNNEASSWLPASAESTQALEKLEPFQDPNVDPDGRRLRARRGLTDEDLAAIDQHQLAAVPGAATASRARSPGPIPSRRTARSRRSIVTFNFGENGWDDMPDAADELRDIAAIDGVSVYVAGPGGQAADSGRGVRGHRRHAAPAHAVRGHRDPAAHLPQPGAVGAADLRPRSAPTSSSGGVIYFLAKYADLTVNGQTQAILTVLVIGAGTDYALLLVARYREELRRHEDRHEAMAFALHRAAPAILASAATVALGMLCLMFAEMNSTAGLGPVIAIGVAVTFLVMVTLLPALLVICGRWVFWPARPTFGSAEPTTTGFWARVGSRIALRPRTGLGRHRRLLLAVACLGCVTLDTAGLSDRRTSTPRSSSRSSARRCWSSTGWSTPPTPIMVVAERRPGRAPWSMRLAGGDRRHRARRRTPVVKDGVAYSIRGRSTPTRRRQAASRRCSDVRDAVHAVDGADALGRRRVGGLPRHQGRLDPRQQGDHPDHAARWCC